MISISSVLSALAFFTIVLGGVCALRLWTGFLKRSGVPILLLASFIAVLRLILPFELPPTYTIRSWNLMGTAQRFLREHEALVQLLLVIWGVVGAVILIKDIYVFCCARRHCRSYLIVKNELVEQVVRQSGVKCPVLVSPDVEGPCVAGVFHPTIYFPDEKLSEQEIRFILAHEVQHVKNHDALIKLFFGLMSAVMWWNPAVWAFRKTIDSLLEFRCDAKVTEHLSRSDQTRYAVMLESMVKRGAEARKVPALALNEFQAVGKEKVVIQRVKVILGYEGKPQRMNPMALCLVVLLFCASYLVMFQPAEMPRAERFEEETGVYYHENIEGLEKSEGSEGMYNTFICKGTDGRYTLFVNYEFVRYLSEEEMDSDEYKDLYLFEEEIQK